MWERYFVQLFPKFCPFFDLKLGLIDDVLSSLLHWRKYELIYLNV